MIHPMGTSGLRMLTISLVLLAVSKTLESAPTASTTETRDKQYWIHRKAEFIKDTTFPLSEDNLRMIGGAHSSLRETHLPFWFDFELFKTAYKKHYASEREELARHYAYVRTCVRTLKARVLFRILAGTRDTLIEADADRLSTDPYIGNLLPSSIVANSDQASTQDELSYQVKFEIEQQADESPLDKAIRLVRQELDRVESRNQLVNYIQAFDEVERGESAIPAKRMPFASS